MNLDDYFSGKAQCNFHESRAWLLIPKKTELGIIKGVTRFLHFFFTKNIQLEHEYLPSALFADYVCSKGASGIYYPGIRNECDTFSVALTPEFVDIGLSLEFAFESRIYILDDNFLIESEFTAKPSKGKLFYNIGKSDKEFNTEKEISALFDEYKKRRVNSLGGR